MGITAAGASLAAAIIGSAAAGATTVSAAKANKRGAKLARELNAQNIAYQREQNDTNYQRAIAAWQMENEYNSPKAQMQRYQEAGLNPNLIYSQSNEAGSIGIPAGEAPQSSMDEATIATQSANNFLNLGSVLGDSFNKYQQAQLQEEQIRALKLKNDEQETNNSYQQALKDLEVRGRSAEAVAKENQNDLTSFQREQGVWQLQIDSLNADINQKREAIDGMRLSNSEKRFYNDRLNETYKNQQDLIRSQINSSIADTALKHQQYKINLPDVQISEIVDLLTRGLRSELTDGKIQGYAKKATQLIDSFLDSVLGKLNEPNIFEKGWLKLYEIDDAIDKWQKNNAEQITKWYNQSELHSLIRDLKQEFRQILWTIQP